VSERDLNLCHQQSSTSATVLVWVSHNDTWYAVLYETYITASMCDDLIQSRRAASVDANTHSRRAPSHSVTCCVTLKRCANV